MSAKVIQPPQDPSPLDVLCRRLNLKLPHIDNARSAAMKKKEQILKAIRGIELPDMTALVVFGSLARQEWTSGSDVDWTFLINGPSDPQHFRIVATVTDRLKRAGLNEPGATRMFGTMASSHELVHHIGGDSDSNANMTRRTLLLLESSSIDQETVRQSVIKAVLERYIVCGSGLPDHKQNVLRCPRFLLNDVVRLWRTFAVDYAAKKWQQADDKWALRNAKLRIPRKLTFAKGLLLCIDCELFADESPWQQFNAEESSIRKVVVEEELLNGCFELLQLSPLEALARVCDRLKGDAIARKLFPAYDEYLALINNEEQRMHLEKNVAFENALEDKTFAKVREISHDFGAALEELFFEQDDRLTKLTRKYGVF